MWLSFQRPSSHIIWNPAVGFHKAHHSMWCLEGFKLRTSLKPCSVLTFFSHTRPTLVSTLYICININLTHKTETGTANRWGTTNSNHLDQLSWLANQKHWVAVKSYLLHSFCAGVQQLCLLLATATCASLQIQTTFLSQTDIFWLSFIQFYCADHILSTA
jgi:hypothetical protein